MPTPIAKVPRVVGEPIAPRAPKDTDHTHGELPTGPGIACQPTNTTTFSDNDFQQVDWDISALGAAATPATPFSVRVTPTGATGPYQAITLPSSQPLALNVAHLLVGLSFDPHAEGKIVSISGGYRLLRTAKIAVAKPVSFALLLFQSGSYYRGPITIATAPFWANRTLIDLTALDFVNLDAAAAVRHPNFTCQGAPIRAGFVAFSSIAGSDGIAGIDDWHVAFHATCCGDRVKRDHVGPRDDVAPPRGKCCCDDEAVQVDASGTVLLPADTDTLESPPVFEYVEQDMGDVAVLYPGVDTTVDTWQEKFPCERAIGGTLPDAASMAPDPGDLEFANDYAAAEQEYEKNYGHIDPTDPLDTTTVAAPTYYPGEHKPYTRKGKYVFGGRDIVFVHGLKLGHLAAGRPGWQQPSSFPADSANADFYSGYYYQKALVTWQAHIQQFLINHGYRNRVLIVSYSCGERLQKGARAVLAQIGDAMVSGVGVLNPNNDGNQGFGRPSFVIISHSTGGLIVDVALALAAQHPGLNAGYIPQYCKAHVAIQGAHMGSELAKAAIVLTSSALVPANPLITQVMTALNEGDPNIPAVSAATVMNSVLLDLVPSVAQQVWGGYVSSVPVRTVTVVGAHPTLFKWFKHVLARGFDDGVLTINSQVANPNNADLWPSGFRTDPSGLLANYDMGVRGLGANQTVSYTIGGGPLLSLSVAFSNNSLNSPKRALGYYLDQRADARAPLNQALYPIPHYFAAGATPYIAPSGLLQTVSTYYTQPAPVSGNPLNRTPGYFSYLQSASDHFTGTHDRLPYNPNSFSGSLYANSPDFFAAGERNFEETRVITDPGVYQPVPMPDGDNEPLLRPANTPAVIERVRGLRVTFTVKIGKKWKKTTSKWIWKRRYHLLQDCDTRRQCDYMYESVLKN